MKSAVFFKIQITINHNLSHFSCSSSFPENLNHNANRNLACSPILDKKEMSDEFSEKQMTTTELSQNSIWVIVTRIPIRKADNVGYFCTLGGAVSGTGQGGHQPRGAITAFFKKAFLAVDENGDGILTLEEIQKLAFVAGIQITQEDIAEFKKMIGCPCRGSLKDKCVYQVSYQRR